MVTEIIQATSVVPSEVNLIKAIRCCDSGLNGITYHNHLRDDVKISLSGLALSMLGRWTQNVTANKVRSSYAKSQTDGGRQKRQTPERCGW